MKLVSAIAVMLLFVSGSQQTWTGEISDGLCRAEHMPLSEGDPILPSPECVRICHRSDYKYVFVLGDKVYEITNQDNPDLDKFAGQSVKVTGELKGEAISISRIEGLN